MWIGKRELNVVSARRPAPAINLPQTQPARRRRRRFMVSLSEEGLSLNQINTKHSVSQAFNSLTPGVSKSCATPPPFFRREIGTSARAHVIRHRRRPRPLVPRPSQPVIERGRRGEGGAQGGGRRVPAGEVKEGGEDGRVRRRVARSGHRASFPPPPNPYPICLTPSRFLCISLQSFLQRNCFWIFPFVSFSFDHCSSRRRSSDTALS